MTIDDNEENIGDEEEEDDDGESVIAMFQGV